ncbi:MAG: hypothetical protein EXQ50_14970 [Acidobacteria bacterium]|nr:hypothetical protein [Acidobacteriota bacterium]
MPATSRSMIAGSKTRVARLVGLPRCQSTLLAANGSSGQLRHVTRVGAITSALKPSAHSRRLAATSAYTSPFFSPYLTLTSSAFVSAHRNFGVKPVSGFLG